MNVVLFVHKHEMHARSVTPCVTEHQRESVTCPPGIEPWRDPCHLLWQVKEVGG